MILKINNIPGGGMYKALYGGGGVLGSSSDLSAVPKVRATGRGGGVSSLVATCCGIC